ncbi:MAG TPA: Asp23/Gls24 family envelope stress response protein [Anaerolineae bacterium]|nr:Asp23/Gls24 family envelope stress response protein [Anaerolineae bacterium]
MTETTETYESIGKIEVAPEVLSTIAQYTTLRVEGVEKMAPVPADVARLFRRENRHSGVLLELTENNSVKFDIYVIMSPHVNIMETSKRLQTAVKEAVDTMVGVPVDAVNVHVEDVVYAQGEAV